MKKCLCCFFASFLSLSIFAQEILDENDVVLRGEAPKKAVEEIVDNQIVYLVEPVKNQDSASVAAEKSDSPREKSPSPAVIQAPKKETSALVAHTEEKVSSENEKKTENSSETENAEIVPSRTIFAKQNQHISIVYDGAKWTYLGEEGEEKLTSYDGSAVKEKTTEFYIFAKKQGSALLHFYRNDVIEKKYIDDYVRLEIEGAGDAESDSEEKKNPDSAENGAEKKSGETKENSVSEARAENSAYNENPDPTSFKIESKSEKPDSPSETDAILEQAQSAYDAGNFTEAKELLDTFFGSAITNLDRGLFLQGQILESYSPIRNIKGALSSYRNLLINYPASTFASEAERRAIYLERFYFNIY